MTVNQEAPSSLRSPVAVIREYLRGSISISYLLGLAWTGRLIIVATTLAGLLYGAYTVHRNGPTFVATMRVAPAETEGSLSGAGGLLAGLAGGTAAVALPKFTEFLLVKGSVGVAEDLDRKYGMLCRIYRGECDPVTHQWKERTGLREWVNAMLARLAGLPDPNGPRKIDDLANYIATSVIPEENKTNSLVSIRYSNSKPEFAAQFLAAVVTASNDYVRTQSRETQKRYVEYLSGSAARTSNVEQRLAIDTLLLQEERQLMMTEVDIPYAAKVLEQPIVTPVNDALKTIAIYTIVGFILGAIAAASRNLLPCKWRFW
jgi:hypothetical protein